MKDWKLNPNMVWSGGTQGFEIQKDNDGEVVAEFVYDKSDAILIAAAPDLLEALQDAHRYLRSYGDYKGSGLEKDIKSAINKALSTTDYN